MPQVSWWPAARRSMWREVLPRPAPALPRPRARRPLRASVFNVYNSHHCNAARPAAATRGQALGVGMQRQLPPEPYSPGKAGRRSAIIATPPPRRGSAPARRPCSSPSRGVIVDIRYSTRDTAVRPYSSDIYSWLIELTRLTASNGPAGAVGPRGGLRADQICGQGGREGGGGPRS